MPGPPEVPVEPGNFGINKVTRPSLTTASANVWDDWGRYIIYTWSGITAEVLLLAVGLDVQKILRAGRDKAVTSIDGTESEGKWLKRNPHHLEHPGHGIQQWPVDLHGPSCGIKKR